MTAGLVSLTITAAAGAIAWLGGATAVLAYELFRWHRRDRQRRQARLLQRARRQAELEPELRRLNLRLFTRDDRRREVTEPGRNGLLTPDQPGRSLPGSATSPKAAG